MSLKRITLLIFCITFPVLLLCLHGASRYIFLGSFEEMEKGAARLDLERAVNAIRESADGLDSLALDWARWDDAYRFVQDLNQEFVQANLQDPFFTSQRLGLALFLDENGRVAWAKAFDPESRTETPLPEGLAPLLKPDSPLLLRASADQGARGVVLLEHGPMIVAARPVVRSDETGPPKGVLIFGRPLDKAAVDRMAQGFRMNLLINRADSPQALPETRQVMEAGSRDAAFRITESVLSAFGVVPDVRGRPALLLEVWSARKIYAQGKAALLSDLLILLVLGGLAAGTLLFLADRYVLSRVGSLAAQVERIGSSRDFSGKVELGGRDELAGLAAGINAMLGEVERTRQELACGVQEVRDNEAFIRGMLDSIQAGVVLSDPESRRILSANAFALARLGLNEEELLGRPVFEVLTPAFSEANLTPAHGSLILKGGSRVPVLKTAASVARHGRPLVLETFLDVSALQQAQEDLRRSEEKYRTLFMSTGTASILIAEDTTILLVNPEFEKLAKVQRSEVEGKSSWKDFFLPDDVAWMLEYHYKRRLDQRAAPRSYEARFVNRDGDIRYVAVTVGVIPDSSLSIASFQDITERKAAEDKLAFQAFHDNLTGLPNRALLTDRLNLAILRAKRVAGRVGVILLDLDDFKHVNDSLGHPAGDRLLRQAAGRLTEGLRKNDTVARLGGDEFMVVVEDAADPRAMARAAQTIIERFSRPFEVDGHQVFVGVSLGIAAYPDDGREPAELIKHADLAMYRSKEQGKNTFRLFTPDMNAAVVRRITLENDLRRALAEQSFVLHYQPRVLLPDGRVRGMEALVRWVRPDGGLTMPGSFIPLAEEIGLIADLDAWVLATACRETQMLRERGRPDLRVSVNVSARNFQKRGLPDLIRRVLTDTGLPASSLEVEITETVLMGNLEAASESLQELADLGVSLALDDFGTGYSSLGYLGKLPLHLLKIDRSFVSNIFGEDHREGEGAAIVRTILTMAGTLGLCVLAEGVETPAQLAFLTEAGCREAQGYLLGRPMPLAEFRTLLGEKG